VAVALLAVVALGAATLMVVGGGDDDPSSSSSSDQGPGPEADEAPPAGEEELSAAVEEISAFVAEERGLEFREPVDVELEPDAAFEERLFEDFDEDVEEIEESQVLWRAMGLIEPDQNLVDLFTEALGAGVVGFYDPETDELVVRGAELTPSVQVTIAHELTHALDDQHFDIDRTEYDDADDEISFGFSALLEGQATVVEEAYLDSLSEAEQDEYVRESMEQGAGNAPDVPDILIQMIVAPYQIGPGFVEALVEAGGQGQMDAAYDDPPRTSEQVIDPEAYLEGEGAVEVNHPSADGEAIDEGVFGALSLGVILSDSIGTQEAQAAAIGWGGDWMTWWEEGDRSCMRATFVGDTADDTDELADAWSAWSEETDAEATVDQPAAAAPVTLTSCSP
jgi:hypothetical protein